MSNTEKRYTLNVRNFRVGSVRYTSNPHGEGFTLMVQMGKGAGYRFLDFPGYQMSIHAPWYRHLSISGRTFTFGRNYRNMTTRKRIPTHVSFRKGGGDKACPAWW